MKTIKPSRPLFAAVLALILISVLPAMAADQDAKNFITVATAVVPSDGDARIPVVSRQFADIQASCARTSRGGAIWDKLAKAHSLLRAPQSLLALLSDFVRVARASCSKLDDSTLISLYVIERNAGIDHAVVINPLVTNPEALVRKYGS